MKATLYSFQFCSSHQGVWAREWGLDKPTVEAKRQARIDGFEDEAITDEESFTGQFGEVGSVETHEVELSAAGLLEFAECYAIGDDCAV